MATVARTRVSFGPPQKTIGHAQTWHTAVWEGSKTVVLIHSDDMTECLTWHIVRNYSRVVNEVLQMSEEWFLHGSFLCVLVTVRQEWNTLNYIPEMDITSFFHSCGCQRFINQIWQILVSVIEFACEYYLWILYWSSFGYLILIVLLSVLMYLPALSCLH